MAYKRGTGTVEQELEKLQSWTEFADIDLYGRNGDKGLIRDFRDDRATSEANQRFVKGAVTLMAALGGVPALIVILQILHVIPR